MTFKSVFKEIFPFLSAASSLGGPLGTMAAARIGAALGVDKVEADKIQEKLAEGMMNPETLAKLKQAEHEFELQMRAMGFENIQKLEQIAAEDRANARAREIAVKDRLPAVLAVSVTIGFFLLITLIVFRTIPMESQAIVNIMVGSLGTAWVGIINYYFGSSAGSAAKNSTIENLAAK